MLHSSRRFKEIKVNPSYKCQEAEANRIAEILGNFKSHTKRLAVFSFPLCSQEISTPIMDAMTDVEELSLFCGRNEIRGYFDLQKDFTKLKRLEFCGYIESSGILNKIPDNTLDALKIKLYHHDGSLNQQLLQAFVNRQMKLKKLEIPPALKLELGHLKLEELTMDIEDERSLTAFLKQQPALRELLYGAIGSASFDELRKMRNLEVLRGELTGGVRGQLANLKELRFFGDASILLQVTFPKLTTFMLREGWADNEPEEPDVEPEPLPGLLGPEHIISMSRSSPNLKHIAVKTNRIDFLPTILENYAQLETLRVEPLAGSALVFPPPSRPHLSLKQLVIERQIIRNVIPDASVYQTVAMCPNLERVCLGEIVFTKHEILSFIQSHPRLTHFYFGPEIEEGPLMFNEHGTGAGFLDPTLLEIIEIFRNSPHFVFLRFFTIADWGDQRIEDLLGDDADLIQVTKDKFDDDDVEEGEESAVVSAECGLTLRKKVHDPFINFRYNRIVNNFWSFWKF